MNSIFLLSLKEQLLKASKDIELSGHCRHKTGNLSVINRKEQYIIITPSGISKAKLVLADLVVCDFEGNILDNPNNNKPSSELPMHIACYKNRADVHSVVHTHSTYARAFAVKGLEIPPVVTESVFYKDKTTVIGYGKPGSRELAEKVTAGISEDTDVLILEKHGVIIMGEAIAETVLKAKYVEEVAKVALLSSMLNENNL